MLVKQLSASSLRYAIACSSPNASGSFITETPYPIRSARARSIDSRIWKRKPPTVPGPSRLPRRLHGVYPKVRLSLQLLSAAGMNLSRLAKKCRTAPLLVYLYAGSQGGASRFDGLWSTHRLSCAAYSIQLFA